MGNDQDDAKKAKVERPKRAAIPAPAAPADELTAEDKEREKFFVEAIEAFAKMTDDHHVLVSVPVWGYPGHGKTTSVLTAIRYCQASLHGASLALVTDTDELEPVASKYPQHSLDDLRVAADTTREYLNDLAGRFFRENEWPDATEQPAQYLLELQTLSGTLGYVLLPDIKGGSYEAADDVAKNALENAHAMMVLVDPKDFVNEDDPRAAEYRKDVLRRIQRCARDKIPTCVMVTMGDAYHESGDSADKTEKELARLLAGQRDFKGISRLLRVSAIGPNPGKVDYSEKPPPAKERHPDALIDAWVWTLKQALSSPRDQLRKQVPNIHLRTQNAPEKLDAPSVATLRQLGSAYESPGSVECTIEGDANSETFLFCTDDNRLIEMHVARETGEWTHGRELTSPEPFTGEHRIDSIGAAIFAGLRTNVSSLLVGTRGQQLIKTSLPVALQSWKAIEAKRLVGITADGTVHSLYLRGSVWEDTDHVPNVFAPAPHATCSYVSDGKYVVVLTGTDATGIDLSARWRFGNVRKPAIPAKFDGDRCTINALGYYVARMSDNTLVAGREKQSSLGQRHAEWIPETGLADELPLVSWISPAGRLRAASLEKRGTVTAEEVSPVLPRQANGIAWSRRGDLVVVTLIDGAALVFRRFGF